MGSRGGGRVPRVRAEVAERLIKELGMSLPEAARLLGVSTSAVSKILQRRSQESKEPFNSVNNAPIPPSLDFIKRVQLFLHRQLISQNLID